MASTHYRGMGIRSSTGTIWSGFRFGIAIILQVVSASCWHDVYRPGARVYCHPWICSSQLHMGMASGSILSNWTSGAAPPGICGVGLTGALTDFSELSFDAEGPRSGSPSVAQAPNIFTQTTGTTLTCICYCMPEQVRWFWHVRGKKWMVIDCVDDGGHFVF